METELQVASSFTSTPIAPSLGRALAGLGLSEAVGFIQYSQLSHYMLSVDTATIAGTLVLIRTEDWVRDSLKSQAASAPIAQQELRDSLRLRTDEFVRQITELSRRGKPVWCLPCPSNGWIADRHRLQTLFQIYTNLLATRLRSVPQITTLAWPAAALPREVEDRAADRLGHIPFTQETFDKLGTLLAEQVVRTWKREHPASTGQRDSAAALAEYLNNLHVQISLTPALPKDRDHIDRLLRTAASISLTGEQRDLTDAQIEALLTTRENVLVNVKDRLADYGVAGVASYRFENKNLIVDAMSVSCAVLGKQVEYGIVSALVQIAAEHELSNVVFEFRPAARNQATAAFLKSVADIESERRYVLPVKMAEARLRDTNIGALSLKFSSNFACSW